MQEIKTLQKIETNDNHQTFKILSDINKSMCLTISQNPRNYGQLVIWEYQKGPNQHFMLINSNQRVLIKSKATGQLLTVHNKSDNSLIGIMKEIYTNSFFKLQPIISQTNKGQEIFIIETNSGKAMHVQQSQEYNGTTVIQQQKNYQKNQLWHFQPIQITYFGGLKEKQLYKITSALGDKLVLDISQSTWDHKGIILWTSHGGRNQTFSFKFQNNKAMIKSQFFDMIMQVKKNSTDNGANIVGKENNLDEKGSYFTFQKIRSSYYLDKNAFYIITHCGKVFDAQDSKAQKGTKIHQRQKTQKNNQIWFIDPI